MKDVAREASRDHHRERRCVVVLDEEHVDVAEKTLCASVRGEGARMEIERATLAEDRCRARPGNGPRDAASGDVEERATRRVDRIALWDVIDERRGLRD